MRLHIGQFIANRYEVLQAIGTGSGSEVYKVRDSQRSAVVALKLLRTDLADSPDFLERFKGEAKVLADLSHPNIVRFYEFIRYDNLTFIVMDFIEGRNLRQIINQRTTSFTVTECTKILTPICSALNFAHGKGFVHCDIKPENILVDPSGKYLLSDFGIVSVTGQREVLPGGIGTPAYMAPEQILNEELLPQTDIYAIGIMLFELLTGQKPFQGKSGQHQYSQIEGIKWEHLHCSPLHPSLLNPSVPPEADELILHCLEKEPQNRYHNATQISFYLESIARKNKIFDHDKVTVPTISNQVYKHGKKPYSLILVGFSLIAIIIILVLSTTRNGPSTSSVTLPIAQVSNQVILTQDTCMKIPLNYNPEVNLHQCVTAVSRQEDGSIQVNYEGVLVSMDARLALKVHPDSQRHNYYLIDNLGNRIDHISEGGESSLNEIELDNGEKYHGWFIFPKPDSQVSYVYFCFQNQDTSVQTPPINLN